MVSFDAAVAGTPVSTWNADARLHDRAPLDLDGVDQLLVVAAHPDDETLGAGGLIAECARRGIPVTVVVVTDGGAAPAESGIVARRSAELAAALEVLAPEARVRRLGVPDGATREHRDVVRDRLARWIRQLSPHALVAAPWRGDGHRDHRVVGEVVVELVGRRTLVEYPIWMWHWADPRGDDVPWERLRSIRIDASIKERALACFPSQTAGDAPVLRPDVVDYFRGDLEHYITGGDALPGSYFDDVYDRHDDPWGFDDRWYEQRKRDLTLASLPARRFDRALEIGCSIGVLTDQLARRCADLLALDVSQAAVDRARQRLDGRARVARHDVLDGVPTGPFDLIVLSEVGYYFGTAGLADVLDGIERSLAAGGTLVACHWRHPVADYPLSGDEVHEQISSRGWSRLARHEEADFLLEVFSSDERSVAAREGLR